MMFQRISVKIESHQLVFVYAFIWGKKKKVDFLLMFFSCFHRRNISIKE